MIRVFGDFETYWVKGQYSLSSMSPVEYILDPRYQTLGCSVAIERDPPTFLPQDEINLFLRDLKQPYCFISHNALFDACVLAFRYNIHPRALYCTMSMCQAVLFHELRNGRVRLAEVVKHLRVGEKGDTINKMSGKDWQDITADPGLLMEFMGYANNDLEGCREVFFRLNNQFPVQEAMFMDRVIKMATRPRLQLDIAALGDYRASVMRKKHEFLQKTTTTKAVLMSNEQFAKALLELDVELPMKISPTTGQRTYAFAKSDQDFIDLLDHPDPQVAALVEARLAFKSTIEETRASRLINIGLRTFGKFHKALLPVPLKFSGAHTHRLSGDWKLNLQNLSARKSKEIRKCILAPVGYTIVAVDAAQIEARIVAWLAQQLSLLDMFGRDEDTYAAFARDIFRVPEATRPQRFVGKTCILGLGFGMSSRKLYRTIIIMAREQGYDIEITMQDCERWVAAYRRKFPRIPQCWRDLGVLIDKMARGQADGYSFGPCVIEGTTIILPSGLRLFYDDLHDEYGEYWFTYGRFVKKLYGGKLLENVVQALDRQHVMEAGVRTEFRARKLGISDPRVLLNIHDENVFCVPDDEAYSLAELALEDMRTNALWSEGLPLQAEVKVGKNFGELEEWRPHF